MFQVQVPFAIAVAPASLLSSTLAKRRRRRARDRDRGYLLQIYEPIRAFALHAKGCCEGSFAAPAARHSVARRSSWQQNSRNRRFSTTAASDRPGRRPRQSQGHASVPHARRTEVDMVILR